MAKRRFRHTPEIEMMDCSEHGHVTAPCLACHTLVVMATGLLPRRSDRGYRHGVLEFDFEPEEAENYRRFRAEYPHGMGPVADQDDLDNSVAVARITEEESWFVKPRKRKSEPF